MNVRQVDHAWRRLTQIVLQSRFPIGVLLLVLGLARINPYGFFPRLAVSFGNDLIFGIILFSSGVLLLMSLRWRLSVTGKIVAALAAASVGAWSCAVCQASPASALTGVVIVFVLLCEAGAYE